ncbi:Crp/Fnr family transcriptional regulator [Lichenibacterium minor]|jgi:CRP-like cAMP-binding protein|uniref:Crp/Fnr family transcriptional regulator n=1 Tax=Lichenibacterium minor TaxID=2316528 RepID=A0A4Q2UBD0_9HYPH|nr:Crp/Fnr family transcriptional regulator [Lichenibacterium minor]RYC33912.1 Crp/Fnr family transcriptional regulator [Lichenibacterium minor]
MGEVGNAGLLVRKVASVAHLSAEERAALERLPMSIRSIPARQDIVRVGDRPSQCCLVLAGFAFRYKLIGEGRRQILNFHVPGDIPDLQSLHLPVIDHNLAALTPLTAGFIRHDAVHEVSARFPRITGALWRNTLVDAAILRERVVSIGQRDGLSRTAHFLCEMAKRLVAVDLAPGLVLPMPITQVEIADALGLSPVHVNRMVRELRERRLIALDGQRLEILDWDALARLGDFDATFLHLQADERPRLP